MGCGGSKLDPNSEDFPARLKPILQGRLEQIRAKKTDENINDHSNKELLGEPTNSHDEIHNNHEEVARNCEPTFHITQDSPPTLQKIGVDNSEKSSQEVKCNVNDNDCEVIKPLILERSLSQCGSGSGRMDERRVLRKRHMSEGSFVGKVEEFIDSDDCDQGDLSRGSPSFRVYCTDVSSEGDDHFDEHDGEEDTVEDPRYSISQESSCSNEVSVKHIPAKKGRRGRMFKITMPKGGKLYKNMQSLYYNPCSSQPNTNLLQKAAA